MPQTRTTWISSNRNRLFFLLSILLIISAYSNSFFCVPALDDYSSFIQEPSIRIGEWNVNAFMYLLQRSGIGRIIPNTLFSIDLQLGEGNLAVFHATNLVIHLLGFIAVYALVKLLISKTRNEIPSSFQMHAGTIAVGVAVLWALNPVQVTAVTYLVQRITSVMSLFFVTAVAAYVAARARGRLDGRGVGLVILCVVSSIGAFLSKQNSVMLPVVIGLTDLWFFDRDFHRRVFAFAGKHRVWTGVALVVVVAVLIVSMPSMLKGYADRHFTMVERILTQFRVVVWYISAILWPSPGRLSLEHDFELSTSLIDPPTTLVSILVILALVAGTIRYRARFPLMTYGMAWFIVNLVVESSFIPLEMVFEHRMYLPSVGFMLTLGAAVLAGLGSLLKGNIGADVNKGLVCVVAVISSVLCLATFERNTVWENGVTLTKHDVDLYPNSPRALSNHAVALCKAGDYEETITMAERAIAAGKKGYEYNAVARNAILLSLVALGRTDEAIATTEEYLDNLPRRYDVSLIPIIQANLARVCFDKGEHAKAFKWAVRAALVSERLDRITDIHPSIYRVMSDVLTDADAKGVDIDGIGPIRLEGEHPSTWIARYLQGLGCHRFASSLVDLRLSMEPTDSFAQDLARDMRKRSEANAIQAAKSSFKRRYLHRPVSWFNAYMGISFLAFENDYPALWGLGRYAIERALKLDPDSSDANLLMAWCLYREKNLDGAIATARHAAELDPESSKAWLGLGLFLAETPDKLEAASAFRKVLELYPDYPNRRVLEALILKALEGDGAAPDVIEN